MFDYRPIKKVLDCFDLLVPDNGGKGFVVLRRLPTKKELQAAAENIGELEYRAQMDRLDRQQATRRRR